METHIDFEYHRVREECKMSEMCEKQIWYYLNVLERALEKTYASLFHYIFDTYQI
jgi:hypothetical protein